MTRYEDVLTVLLRFSADADSDAGATGRHGPLVAQPDRLRHGQADAFHGCAAHTRLRALASDAFAPDRVDVLRTHIQEIATGLSTRHPRGKMDMIADLAAPLPAIVTAEMLGVPVRTTIS